jgi:hypothetical protein
MDVFIYSLSDPRTKEIRYVGKAIDADKRFKAHVANTRTSDKKGAWIKKLKSLGLVPELDILETVRDSDDTDWQECERWWIAYLKMIGCPLTNLESGGIGGKTASQETREKQRAAMLKFYENNPDERIARANEGRHRKHSPEAIEKMRAVQSIRSQETIERMRIAAARRGVNPATVSKMIEGGRKYNADPALKNLRSQRLKNAMTPERIAKLRARKFSEETRQKMSAAKIGKKQSPESILKRSAALRGKKRTPEERLRISERTKAQWANTEKRATIHSAIRRKHALPIN